MYIDQYNTHDYNIEQQEIVFLETKIHTFNLKLCIFN